MIKKEIIYFLCYEYQYCTGVTTLFLFYPSGEWDEDKDTLQEALVKYPPTEYEWVYSDSFNSIKLKYVN